MTPQIVDTIHAPRSNSPAFSQIEKHISRLVKWVKDHEDYAITTVSGPILRRVCGIRNIVRIDTPAERRNGLANIRVLVNLYEVAIAKYLNRLARCVGKISPYYQWTFQQRPGCEMALRFVVRQVAYRVALPSISDLEHVHVVVTIESCAHGQETGLVNDGSDCAPPRFDISINAPAVTNLLAPNPGLLPTPFA